MFEGKGVAIDAGVVDGASDAGAVVDVGRDGASLGLLKVRV